MKFLLLFFLLFALTANAEISDNGQRQWTLGFTTDFVTVQDTQSIVASYTGSGSSNLSYPLGSSGVDVSAGGFVSLSLLGTWIATTNFQCSNDSTNWESYPMARVGTPTVAPSASVSWIATSVIYVAPVQCKYVRVLITPYTSGTVNVELYVQKSSSNFFQEYPQAAIQQGIWTTRIQDTTGNTLSSTSNALNTFLTNSSIPVTQSGTWTTGRTWSLLNSTDSVNAVQSGPWTVTANAGTNLDTSLLALDSTVAKDSSLSTINTSINTLLKPANTLAAVTTLGSITNALPTGTNSIGQVTANAGINLNTSALALSSTQTDGSQKTKLVDSSNSTVGPVTALSGTNYMPVVLAASSTAGAAIPTRSILIAGSDGTNAQNFSVDTTGKLNINNISGVVSLPTGAATSANQTNGLQKTQQVNGTVATYSFATQAQTVPNLATDILQIKGSGTKTIQIKNISIVATKTTTGTIPVNLIKRSTATTGGGAGSVVQFQSTNSAVSSTTAAITVTATGAGNLIVIGANNSDNRTVSSISDGTSAFTQATNAPGSNGSVRSDIWYLLNSNAGKTTFTVTFSGTSTTKSIFFWEISGTGAASFDIAGHTTNQALIVGNNNGAAVTNTGSGFIAAVINPSSPITVNPATGNEFTTSGGINANGNAGASLSTNTVGSHTPAWTAAGTGLLASSTASFLISGSSGTTVTAVPHDSTDAAATAVVDQYGSLPTVGTAVGSVRTTQLFVPTNTAVSPPQPTTWTFDNGPDKGIVLRGTNEALDINIGGTTVPGGSFSIFGEWTEE